MKRKKEVRQDVQLRLKKISAAAQAEKSRKICAVLYSLPAYRQAKQIFAFLHMENEVDLDPFITQAIIDGKEIFVPVCLDKTRMEAARLYNLASAVPGKYGIRTAPKDNPQLEPFEFDLIIVPGLAFDAKGHRLGHGAAYYDRFLMRSQGVKTVAVAFSEQLLAVVPTEEHDVLMRELVTDQQHLCFDHE